MEVYTKESVKQLIQNEFMSFVLKHHGVLHMSDIQTLAKFIEQLHNEINKVQTNEA